MHSKKVIFLFFIFLFLSFGRLMAQESNATVNEEGKDISQLKHTWNAQWITHPTESTLDYGVFLFRRSFDLNSKPDSFLIYVSADNRYRLFVNGEYVCFGPSVGDISHYRYETVDIAKYLKTGKNTIAAEVVNFGEFRRGAQQTFLTAFILQSAKENNFDIDTGDGQWKVVKNRAYEYIPFTSDSVRGYYAAGPGDRVDASKYPWGWQNPDFDDSGWQTPRKAMVEFAVGRGFLYGSTWYLVPRTIPFMEETEQRFKKVARFSGSETDDNFILGNHPVAIPPNTKASILLDQGVHTVAYPELLLSGGKGSKIKATYSEALVFNEVLEENYVDGNQNLNDIKGDRNIIEGKSIFGVYDVFCPDGEKNRLFKPLWMRTFRYIQLDIETAEDSLVIHDYKSVYSAYPFKEIAKFSTDDPLLSEIWKVAWRTTRNSSGELIQDSPYYEQLQYIGDTRLISLITIYVSGDDRLMRKAIKTFDDSRLPNGLTQSRYPSYINQVIPTYSLLWIGMLNDYYQYRNDPEFIRQFLPGMRNVLEWFEQKMDSTNLITNLEWWNFIDWAPEFSNGIPPGADDGYSAMVALQYVYFFNSFKSSDAKTAINLNLFP
jgi:alpha-L-rhamnosidase